MFSGLQGWHIIVIVVAIVLLFGAKRLPDAAKGVGKSLRIFKSEAKAMRDQEDGSTQSGSQSGGQEQAPAAEQLPAANDTGVSQATEQAQSTTPSSTEPK